MSECENSSGVVRIVMGASDACRVMGDVSTVAREVAAASSHHGVCYYQDPGDGRVKCVMSHRVLWCEEELEEEPTAELVESDEGRGKHRGYEVKGLVEALEKIASCEKHIDGDAVDIAREALAAAFLAAHP